MTAPDYKALLNASKTVYQLHDEMMAFAPFPDDIISQPLTPCVHPASDLLQSEADLTSTHYQQLTGLIQKTAPQMCWRDIYTAPQDARNKQAYEFSKRLGCYSLIGNDAPFASHYLRLFMVYMPANLHYPRHSHPAEEIYLVLSGNAVFKRKGYDDEHLGEGQTMFHQSELAHAIETSDKPMVSLVAWRNHFDIPPILLEDI